MNPVRERVIQHEDENVSHGSAETLCGSQGADGNPSFSTVTGHIEYSIPPGQKNYAVVFDGGKAINSLSQSDENKKERFNQQQPGQELMNNVEESVTTTQPSREFPQEDDWLNKVNLTIEPSGESGAHDLHSPNEKINFPEMLAESSIQSAVDNQVNQESRLIRSVKTDLMNRQSQEFQNKANSKQPQKCITKKGNCNNDQPKMSPNDSTVHASTLSLMYVENDGNAISKELKQCLEERVVMEYSHNQSESKFSGLNRSTIESAISNLEQNANASEDSELLLTEQNSKTIVDGTKETNGCEPNIFNAQSTIPHAKIATDIDGKGQETQSSNQKGLAQKNSTATQAQNVTLNTNMLKSSHSSNTNKDRLDHDEQQTKHCDQITSAKPFKMTTVSNTLRGQAIMLTISSKNYEEREGAVAEPKQLLSKSVKGPFPDPAPHSDAGCRFESSNLNPNYGQVGFDSDITDIHIRPKTSSPQPIAETTHRKRKPTSNHQIEISESSKKQKLSNDRISTPKSKMETSKVTKDALTITASEEKDADAEAGVRLRTLLNKRYIENSLTTDDINEAVLLGKPNPPMISVIKDELKKSTQSEELENNEDNQLLNDRLHQMSWITGSNQLQIYCCWPCLLLGDEIWFTPINFGLGNIANAVNNHQTSEPHMAAFMKLLSHRAKLTYEQEVKLERDRECRQKTKILRRLLTEITCTNISSTPEEYVELLRSTCSHRFDLQEFIIEKSSNFLDDFVASNLTPISKAVENLLMEEILAEIKIVTSVAIIFEDTNDVVDKSQIAVILRYMTESGIPHERLVKLIKMRISRTVADFLKLINSVVEQFKLKDKLVGFTYNGTMINPKEIIIFNKTVNRLYPSARFLHYQEHSFKKIITQSLSHIPECRKFLYTINEIAKFLENAPNVNKTLIAVNNPDSNEADERAQWDFKNDVMNTLRRHFTSIIMYFNQIIEKEFDLDSETIMKVKYFSLFLISPVCRVLVLVISSILNVVNDLSKAMESNADVNTWTGLLSEATKNVSSMKHGEIRKLLHENDTLVEPSEYAEVHGFITPQLFGQIIDNALLAMNQRCAEIELASTTPNPGQMRNSEAPEKFSELQNKTKLGDPFSGNLNVLQSISNIRDLKMTDSARNLLRSLRLRHTVPTNNAPSTPSPTVVQLRSLTAKNKSLKFFDLLVSLEKDMLSSMLQDEQFYDSVVKYCGRNDG